jgi:hypothetical protein
MGNFKNWVSNKNCTCECSSCKELKNCKKCDCKNCTCKGCGCDHCVKNKKKNIKENVMPVMDEPRSKDDTNKIIKKLEMKLGQENLKYRPLINYLSRNKDALVLFNDLLEKVGGMSVSSARAIIK